LLRRSIRATVINLRILRVLVGCIGLGILLLEVGWIEFIGAIFHSLVPQWLRLIIDI
jgi:hypothetical protein